MVGGEVHEFMSQSARRCLLCLAKGRAIIHTNDHTDNTEGWKHPLSSVTRGTLFAKLLLAAVTSPNPAGKRLNVCNKQVSNVFTFILYSVFMSSFSMLYTSFYLYALLRPHFYVIGPVTAFSSPHQGLSPSSPYFLSVSAISPISENYYSAKWSHQLSRVLLIKAACDRQWIVIPPPPPPTGWVKALKNIIMTL